MQFVRPRRCGSGRDATDRCDAHHDQTGEQNIVNREAVLQELWNKHWLNPVLTLTEALRRVEMWDDAHSSTAGGVGSSFEASIVAAFALLSRFAVRELNLLVFDVR